MRFIVEYTKAQKVRLNLFELIVEKSRIQETPTLSTDADSRTDTILERLRDIFHKPSLT